MDLQYLDNDRDLFDPTLAFTPALDGRRAIIAPVGAIVGDAAVLKLKVRGLGTVVLRTRPSDKQGFDDATLSILTEAEADRDPTDA